MTRINLLDAIRPNDTFTPSPTSYPSPNLFPVNIRIALKIPRFRIVRTSNGEVHAEFLVVVSIGSHSTVTFGLWRRHSDFNTLAMKVSHECAIIEQLNHYILEIFPMKSFSLYLSLYLLLYLPLTHTHILPLLFPSLISYHRCSP